MKSCGEVMIVERVMRTLTPNFDHVIVAIQEAGNVTIMQMEDLTGSLEAHELMINERKRVQESVQVLQAPAFNKAGGNKDKGHTNMV
jgi:hypothetical protein